MDEALTIVKQHDTIDYGPGFSQTSLVSEKQNGQITKNSRKGDHKRVLENQKSPQVEPVCAENQGLDTYDLTDDFKIIQATCLKTHSGPGTLQFNADSQPERKYPEEDFRPGVCQSSL